jgi:hypothetical protein
MLRGAKVLAEKRQFSGMFDAELANGSDENQE